jgi:hypothetical protein
MMSQVSFTLDGTSSCPVQNTLIPCHIDGTKSCPVQNTFIHFKLHNRGALRRVASAPALSSAETMLNDVAHKVCTSSHSVCSEASTLSDVCDKNSEQDQDEWSHASIGDSQDAIEPQQPQSLTLMMRNIPCCITAMHLAAIIDERGFAGSYDFLYLPSYPRGNLGYAFLDLKDASDAERFVDIFHGFQFPGKSKKVCQIRPAELQGRANYQKAFSHKSPGLYVPETSNLIGEK